MASDSPHPRKLDIPHDPTFQNRTWMIQRVSWVIVGLLTTGALTGLFGHGPIAHSIVKSQSGRAQVRYDRFVRYESPSTFTVSLEGGAVRGTPARISFAPSSLENVVLEQILPPPDSSVATPEGAVFVFQLADASEPAVIIFSVTYRTAGWMDVRVVANETDVMSFSQFVYP